MIRVLVNGALGRMGSEVCKKVYSEADLELVGAVDIKEGTVPLGDVVKVTTDLVAAIEAAKPDVVVDFTRPDVVMGNLRKMLPLGVHAVVGTTGFSDADLKEVDELARKHNTSLLIAPNFALGAVVMMKLACEAAKYFPHVEIIEKHHDNKLDAPSGTATASPALHPANYNNRIPVLPKNENSLPPLSIEPDLATSALFRQLPASPAIPVPLLPDCAGVKNFPLPSLQKEYRKAAQKSGCPLH